MAFFTVHGCVGGGVHSDVSIHTDNGLPRCRAFQHEHDVPHGPVKILVENGRRLEQPKVISVRPQQR